MATTADKVSPARGDRDAAALGEQLADGLARLEFADTPGLQASLLRYLELLHKWNEVYNLTGVRDLPEMVTRHLLDSLAIVPFVTGPRVLDVGTGAGLPGIPLAVALPALEFTLLDSNARKLRFVRQAVTELGLTNVTIVCKRAQEFRESFDVVVARAVARVAELLASAAHLCAPGGRMLIMKGAHPERELVALPAGYAVAQVNRLRVPGLRARRHVVIVVRR